VFGPGLGSNDFNMQFIEPGQHVLRVFARYNLNSELTLVGEAKIDFQADVIAE
jgi:hypothetical protein